MLAFGTPVATSGCASNTQKAVDVPFIINYRLAASKIVQHWMSIDRAEVTAYGEYRQCLQLA